MFKNRRRLLVFIVLIVIVIGASMATAYFVAQQQKNNEPSQTESDVPARLPAENKSDEVEKIAYEGNVQKSTEAFDKAISETSDSYEKFIFYSRKATMLLNNNDVDGALGAAQSAYDIEKTSDSAAFVGQIAQQKGDTALALERYKNALELIDERDPFAQTDRAYYEGIVKDLESGNN